ncbi:host cell division inhibitor Icd-like protein [Escherichia coli]
MSRLSEQLTCRAKNVSEQWDYINRVAKRHNCRITDKTKATTEGRQWESYILERITNNATFAAGRQCDQCGGLTCPDLIFRLWSFRKSSMAKCFGDLEAVISGCDDFFTSCFRSIMACSSFWRCSAKISVVGLFFDIVDTCNAMRRRSSSHGADSGYSCSLALRRWRRFSSSKIFLGKKPAGLFSGKSGLVSVCFLAIHQPFGSMPRLSNSARPSSLSQLARLMPSFCASLSNCSFRSGEIRILNCGDCPSPLGLLSRLIVDKWSPIELTLFVLGDHLNTNCSNMTTPRSGGTHAGRLTTNDNESIEAAMLNHTTHPQGRGLHNLNKFTWRFIAFGASDHQIIHVTAWTEREARNRCPSGCVAVFAAKIRQEVHHVQ